MDNKFFTPEEIAYYKARGLESPYKPLSEEERNVLKQIEIQEALTSRNERFKGINSQFQNSQAKPYEEVRKELNVGDSELGENLEEAPKIYDEEESKWPKPKGLK